MSNLGKNLKNYLQFFRQFNFPNIVGGYMVSSNRLRRFYLNLTVVCGLFFISANTTAQVLTTGTIGSAQSSCTNGQFDPANLTNTLSATGTNLNYQWAYSTATNVYNTASAPLWTLISSATRLTYNPTPINETTYYVRLVRSGTGSWSASNVITVTISKPNFYTTANSNGPLCLGDNLNLSANVYSFSSTELVTNGDFQAGDVNFSSSFSTVAGGDTSNTNCGRRRVNTIPLANWTSCIDVAGHNRVLLINNSSVINARPWFQSVPVVAGITYTFSIEASSISWRNFAQLYLRVNGTTITPVVTLDNPCHWTTITGTYTATTSGLINLEVYNQNGNCTGNDYMLDNISFKANSSAPSGTWSWTGPNGFTSSSPNPTITNITAANIGTYTVTFTSLGCTSTSTVTPTAKATPSVVSSANTVCTGETLNLSATATDPDGGAGTWSWTGPNGFTSTAQNPSINNVTTAMSGTYTVTYTSSNGCGDTATDSEVITVGAVTIASAGADINQCNSGSFTMSANTPVVGTGAWSFFGANNGAVIASATNPRTTVTGLAGSRRATLIWTITNGACVSRDTVVITNYPTNSPGCNCNNIYSQSGTNNFGYSDSQIRVLNTSNGTYSAQFGNTLTVGTFGFALDTTYKRFYYTSTDPTSDPEIYYMDAFGNNYGTSIDLPVVAETYNRAGYNPVDKRVYFISSLGSVWAAYTPSASGSGGILDVLPAPTYYPSTAPQLNSGNSGGDIVFDYDGNGYIISNLGHLYKAIFNSDNTVDIIYLGKLNLPITQSSALAFGADGRLYISGRGGWNGFYYTDVNVYYIDLETLATTQINSALSPSTTDYASCSFPIYRSTISPSKTYTKISGAPGPVIQEGDIVEYRIAVRHTGNISVGNVKLYDAIPAGTTYVAGSTSMNGAAVADTLGGFRFSTVPGGFLINSTTQPLYNGVVSPNDSSIIIFRVRIQISCGNINNIANVTSGVLNFSQSTNTVTIFSNTVAVSNAGPSQTQCNTSTFTLAGNVPPSSGGGLWTIISGPGTITSPTLYNTTVTGVTAGSTTVLRWAVHNDVCSTPVSSTTSLTNEPPITSNAGADQTLCSTGTFTLNATPPPVGTGTWTLVSGTATITSPSLSNTTVTGVPLGTSATLRWTVVNGTCSVSDDVIVTNSNNSLVANAGADISQCGNGTFTMAANNPIFTTKTWTLISGSATIGSNTYNATISNIPVGTSATLRWTVSNGVCSVFDDINLTNNVAPVVNDPSDQTLCSGSSITPVNFSGTATTYNWTNSNPSIGIPASGTGNIPAYNVSNSGVTPVVAIITVTPVNGTCTGTSQTFTITVNPTPLVTTPTSQVLCAGTATAAVNFSGTATTYNWTNNNTGIGLGASGNGNIPSFIATNTGTSPITATIMVTPIIGSCAGTPRTFTITVNPTPSVVDPANQVLCAGATTAAVNFSGTATTYNWTNNNTAIGLGANGTGNIGSFTATNTGGAPLTATITVTPITGSCPGTPQTFTITVNPTPTVTAPSNQTVCAGTATAAVNFSGTATTYNWTNNNTGIGLGASGTGNIGSFTATNTGGSPITATITVTPVIGSCSGTPQTFTITVNPIPSVVDPSNQTLCAGTATTAITFSGTATTYNWSNNNTGIGLGANGTGNIGSFTATNTGGSPITATITVTPVTGGCSGTPQTFTITVNPTPTVTAPSNQTVCAGTATAAVNFSGTATTYNWTNNNTGIGLGASGTGNIGSFTATNTGGSPITATITVTPVIGSCTGTPQTFTITVNPTPSVVDPANQTLCAGTVTTAVNFSGTATTYNWSNNNTGIGLGASGTGNIGSFTATNTGGSPITATITVTPVTGGCSGTPQTFTITVNPMPSVVDPANQVLCAGATTAVNFSGTATTYNWTNNNTGIGLGASGTGNIGSFTATNTGGSPITATITVTPVIGSCSGTPQTFTITVNPTPSVVDPSNQTVCAGTATAAVNFSGTATMYNWTNNNTGIGLGASGTGNIGSFTATNTGGSPITATITVTPVTGGCSGTPQTFTITVNPTPSVVDPSNQTLCAGAATAAVNFSGTATTYNWTNNNTGIGLGASGTGNIGSFTATNTGGSPITATITVTPVTGSCSGAPQTFTITVNPIPTVTAPSNQTVCAGTATTAITFSGTATTYNWTNNNTGIGLGASGTGNIGSFTATNTGGSPITATITVTPVTGGCSGTPQTFTITVNPTPTVTAPSNQTVCAGSATTAINFSGTATTYNWSNNNTAIGLSPFWTGNIPSFTATNTGGSPITATITVTPVSGSCSGTPRTFTITVNPLPTVNSVANRTVCNGSTSSAISFSGTGTSYTWTNSNTSIGLGASGTGNLPSFTAINTGSSAITATITVTPILNGCNGSSRTFTITVAPTPITSITAAETSCTTNDDRVVSGSRVDLTASGTGTFAWNTGGSGATITVYPTSNTTYTVTFTDVNSCVTTATKTITITPAPTANAGVDQTLCTNTFSITGNTPVGLQTGQWSVVSGSATFGSATNPSTTVTVPAGTQATLRWTVSEGACSASDDVVVRSIHAYAGEDQTFCAQPTMVMAANTPLVGTGLWTLIAGTATIATPTSPTTSVSIPVGTTATLRWTVTSAFCTMYDEVVLTNFQSFVANAGPDISQCDNGTFSFAAPGGATSTAACAASAAISNAGFESPFQAANTYSLVNENLVSGWKTTATDDMIEFWGTGFNGVSAYEGNQFVELNANLPSGLYQDLCVLPGDSITWSVAHRGRLGRDSMVIKIGMPGALVQQRRVGTGNTGWIVYTGSYKVPAGQTVTRFQFEAISTATGSLSIGNFIDDVNINLISRIPIPGSWSVVSGTATITSPSSPNTTVTGVPAGTSATLRWTSNNGVCSASDDVVVTNYASPTVNAVSNQAVCHNGATTAVNFTGTGTTYSWVNNNTSIGLAASGTGNIGSFTATNTSTSPVTATITVTPTANGCTGTPRIFTITVNPTPSVSSISNQTVCNGFNTTLITFSGTVSGTTYNWTNNNPSIGLAASGSGTTILAFVATNTGSSPVTATVTVTPVANGCSGTPRTFTYTVNPSPTVTPPSNQTVCSNSVTTAISFGGSAVSGTTYSWVNNTPSIGLGASGSGNIPSFTATNSGTSPITATLTVTPTANGCSGTPQTFTITVNPLPTVTAPSNQTVCNNSSTTAVNFTGAISGTTYNWTNSNPAIGLGASGTGNIPVFTATNATSAAITATITVTPTLNGCTGTPRTFTITVNPTPTVTKPADVAYCNGANSTAINFTGSAVTGTTYNWTNSNPAIGLGASGTGNIAAFTATNSGTSAITATITVTPVANGCTGTPQTFTITVNPTPTVNNVSNQTVCNGGTTTAITFSGAVIGTTYNWTNSNPSIGLGASGTGNIAAFTATNTGSTAITATITVTPVVNGCTGSPRTFTITVNPTPTVNSVSNQTVCNTGTTTAITFSGAVAGTTYNWTNSNPSIGLGASGTGNIAAFTATNSGASAITGTITVTPVVNGCTGTPQTFTITVNPTPTVNSVSNQTVCNGGTTTAITFSGAVTGTTYNWTNSNPSIGLGASGTGNIAAFTATNSGASAITGTITVTPVVNGCTGTPQTFTITVNPTPTVNSVSNQTVCNSGTTTAITFSGAVTGTTYNWTNSNPSIGLGASGTGNIAAFTATNTGIVAITGTITVTPVVNGCTGSPRTFTITVNPTPTVNSVSNQTVCNTGTTTAVTFSGAVAGTTYNWTNSNPSIGLGASGTGNIAAFTATNTGSTAITATITVTPVVNGCTGSPRTFTITVNPTPTVNSVSNQTVCNSGTTTAITFSGAVAGTTYNWTNSNPSIGLGASGTGNIAAFTATNSGTSAITATITVTPVVNGCTGTPQTFTITVNPTPTVNSVSNQTVCNSGTTTAITFSGAVTGTTYNWTNSNPSIGLGASGTGNIAAFTATNTGIVAITGTITVTPVVNGCTGSPRTFTITVNPTPTVNSVSNQTVCNTSTTTAVTFSGAVTGTTYNWTNSNPSIGLGASGTGNIAAFTATNSGASAISGTITVTPVVNGCTGAPRTFTITLNPTPTVNSVSNQTLCNGGTTTAVTFSGAVAGTTYNWTNSNPSIGLGASGTGNIAAFTATNSTASAITATITVTPVANGCIGSPRTFTITVNPNATTSITVTESSCNLNDNKVLANTQVNLSASGTGTFNWDNGLGAGSFKSPIVATTTTYSLVFTDGNGCVATASTTITVVSPPVPTITSAETSCVTNDDKVLSSAPVTLTANGGVSYSWDNALGNTAAVTATPSVTTTYTVVVTDANGCSTAVSKTITVESSPIANAGVDQAKCLINTFTMAATPANVGSGQWSVTSGTASITTSNSPTSNVTVTGSTATLRWTVTNGACISFDEVVLTVDNISTVTITGNFDTICTSGSVVLTSNQSASGQTYQWQQSTNGTTWSDISSATSASYTTPSLTAVTYYRLNVASGVCSGTSNSFKVNMVAKPVVTASVPETTVCIGGGVVITASHTGGTGTCTYQWQSRPDASSAWSNINGATSNTYTTSALNSSSRYRAVLSCSGNGCCD